MRAGVLAWLFVLVVTLLLRAAHGRQLQAGAAGGSGDTLYDSIAALVVTEGYPLELHSVTTQDGYILRLYRIPGPRPGPEQRSAPASTGSQAARSSTSVAAAGARQTQADASGKAAEPSAWARLGTLLSEARAWLRAAPGSTVTPPAGGAMGAAEQRPAAQEPPARPPVLLQHGLLDSCAGFLMNGPGRALAFMLADQGFDVWLANARGSTHSRNHTHWGLGDARYWAFSWDEMARFDLPAELDHILGTTGAPSLVGYVGHSQGTTVALAALAAQPDLAQRMGLVALMAPVAFVHHIASVPLMAMAAMNTDQLFTMLGVHEFMPSQKAISTLEGQLCRAAPALCANILSAIAGYNWTNVEPTRLPLYLEYTPAGTSVQNMAHWSQMVRQLSPNSLAFFDYGTDCTIRRGSMVACNQMRYGRLEPPLYDLGSVEARIALFTGGQDRLSDPLDQEFMLQSLPPVVHHTHIASYEHLDFIWGQDAHEAVYTPLVALMRQEAGMDPATATTKAQPQQQRQAAGSAAAA